MALCDRKAAMIDNALLKLECAARRLKAHRQEVMLYRDTDTSAQQCRQDILNLALTAATDSDAMQQAVDQLCVEVRESVPAAPVVRRIASPRHNSAPTPSGVDTYSAPTPSGGDTLRDDALKTRIIANGDEGIWDRAVREHLNRLKGGRYDGDIATTTGEEFLQCIAQLWVMYSRRRINDRTSTKARMVGTDEASSAMKRIIKGRF